MEVPDWVALPREVAAACGGSRLLASMRPTIWSLALWLVSSSGTLAAPSETEMVVMVDDSSLRS